MPDASSTGRPVMRCYEGNYTMSFHTEYIRRSALLASVTTMMAITIPVSFAAEEGEGVREVLITGTLASDDILGLLRPVSATEITAARIQNQQIRVISDVLRDVPGLAVSRTGTVGGLTQVRIRGGEGNHTLMLIDGIEAGDPFQGEFDFATLIADDIARVEVLRGQQSALYGSDAIGGVIHYITPRGQEMPGFRARAEGGSFGTYAGSTRFAGVAGIVDYVLTGSYYKTDGVVVARNGNDEVGSKNASFSSNFIVTPSHNITLTAIGRYHYLDADSAPQDFNWPPGPDYGSAIDGGDTTEAETFYGLLKGELSLLDGDWTHALSLQGVGGERTNATLGAPTFKTEGSRRKFSYVTSYFFDTGIARNALTFAVDDERETYRNLPIGGAPPAPMNEEREMTTIGIVGEYNFNLGDAFAVTGVYRRDWNSGFEDADTYRVGALYAFDFGLQLHAAYGTGFKAPNNIELFGFDPGTFVGNPDLKPELSRGWELGAEDDLTERISFGATYFSNRLENEIYTIFTPSFESTTGNRTTESRQRGVEVFAEVKLDSGFRFEGSYTYIDATENGVEEVLRAPHIASAALSWRSMDDVFGGFVNLRYNGRQKDNNFTFSGTNPAVLRSFTLVDAGGDWKFNEHLQIFGRIENLFDENYEEVYTFRTAGRAFYVGVRGNI